MKRLLILSDNHGMQEEMNYVIQKYQSQVDGIIHCGDCFPARLPAGVTGVPGNMDRVSDYPSDTQILELEGHRLLIEHGHHTIYGNNPDYHALAEDGKRNQCDVVIFGHTHVYHDGITDGIRLLNPGTFNGARSRDNTPGSVMLVDIDGKEIRAKRIAVVKLLFD